MFGHGSHPSCKPEFFILEAFVQGWDNSPVKQTPKHVLVCYMKDTMQAAIPHFFLCFPTIENNLQIRSKVMTTGTSHNH